MIASLIPLLEATKSLYGSKVKGGMREVVVFCTVSEGMVELVHTT